MRPALNELETNNGTQIIAWDEKNRLGAETLEE